MNFRKLSLLLLLVFGVATFSGCYMFKKKNRCGDCPKWSKH